MDRDMSNIQPRAIGIKGGSATLRTSEPADAGEILALRVSAASETDFLMDEVHEIRRDVDEQATFLAKKLASPVDIIIHAEVDGHVVGIAGLEGSCYERFGHAATLGLAVARAHWGRGIGTALVQALLEWADARGLVRVALEVVETNTRAIRLYEALGFEHEGRLRFRRRHGEVYLDNHQMARVRLPAGVAPVRG